MGESGLFEFKRTC